MAGSRTTIGRNRGESIRKEGFLGRRVISARMSLGLSQTDLSKLVSTSRMQLYRIENDITTPSHSAVDRLCRALGKRPSYFYWNIRVQAQAFKILKVVKSRPLKEGSRRM